MFLLMAVYTHLTSEDVTNLLKHYAIGTLISFKEIIAGVENSNYFIKTSTGKYILTIYEKRVKIDDLPYYLTLMQHLFQKGFPCPTPIQTVHSQLSYTIKGKACAIISFLEGKSTQNIQNHHLMKLGQSIAQMHLFSKNFPGVKPNHFSVESFSPLFERIKGQIDDVKVGLSDEIQDHLSFVINHWPKHLPTGTIHGDIFPDNVFFDDDQLTGVIDYYFACTDFFMYDIAICLNAWCFEQGGDFNITKAKLLLTHYHEVRPISDEELNALPVLASGASLRFLLTRLFDWLNPSKDAVVTPKDPLEYLKKLRFHHHIKSHHEYGL